MHLEEEGRIYLIFSHSFEDTPTGDMVAVELSKDLKRAVGEPKVLFNAIAAPWSRPVPFAKAEFGMEGDVYFTDGTLLLPHVGWHFDDSLVKLV